MNIFYSHSERLNRYCSERSTEMSNDKSTDNSV